MQEAICVRRQERLPGWFSIRLVDGHGVHPQKLGPRCLAKRVQGVDRSPSPEHLPACFGMRLQGLSEPEFYGDLVYKLNLNFMATCCINSEK